MTDLQQQRQAYLLWAKQRGLVWPIMRQGAIQEKQKATFAIRGSGSACPKVVFLTPLSTVSASFFGQDERALLIRMVQAMTVAFNEIYVCGICVDDMSLSSQSNGVEVGYHDDKLRQHVHQLNPKAVVIFQQDLLLDCQFTCPVVRTWHPADLLRSPSRKKETWQQLQQLLPLLI